LKRIILPILLLVTASSVISTSLSAQTTALAPLETRQDALRSFFKDYWDANLQRAPEFASTIGDLRFNDQITDYSVQAYNDWLAAEQNDLMRLAAIDPTGFTDQEKTSRDLLLRKFAEDEEAAEFKEWEMPISQMGGIYSTYPNLVTQLSFNTVKDYDDWTARLRQIPKAFDQVMTNMSIGIDDQRVPPKYLLDKTLDQVQQLAAQKPEDSPLAMPLRKFPASIPAAEQARIHDEMLEVIAKRVLPAYQRLARFLQVTYIPAGRDQPGIWALPDGAQYYKFLIHRSTTTDLTPDELHQIGLNEVKKDEVAMLPIAQKLGFKDLKTFNASLKTNPKLHPASAEALLAAYRSDLTPMQARLPQIFGHLPTTPYEVVAVPEYLQKTAAPAYYEAGTADGKRPGRIFINTYNATSRNLYDVEVIAYHEGLPGHHLQISIAQELEGIPEFRRYDQYTGYTEGWGLYAEQLGKDLGFYQDPYSDFGRLEADMWRSIRLVVDTGVHSKHWTRQQMVEYFHDHTTLDDATIEAEVDRYVAWPGQALAYKVGQLKILELRDKAKAALGTKFDIRAFHDQVLDAGALPLDVLSSRIDAWIASSR
jgi:uncharacterized protein (DUF885 family)